MLEDVVADADLVAACRALRERGYRLALDDQTDPYATSPLLDLVDVVKVDVRDTTPAARAAFARRFLPRGTTLLAEKVETRAEFDEVGRLGYQRFQGYFLTAPTVVRGRAVTASKAACAAVLATVSADELDFAAIEDALGRDPGLTDRLLRYVTSAAHGLRAPVRSLRHALVLLGQEQVRRWVGVVALSGLAGGGPDHLVTRALLRAHLCETLAVAGGRQRTGRRFDAFLAGMYSLADVMLEVPMEEALDGLPLSPDVRAALLGEPNGLRRLLDVAVAYEHGDWEGAAAAAARVPVPLERLRTDYVVALEVADRLRTAA